MVLRTIKNCFPRVFFFQKSNQTFIMKFELNDDSPFPPLLIFLNDFSPCPIVIKIACLYKTVPYKTVQYKTVQKSMKVNKKAV